uniref:Uncharacterized protein n=1 Tax=Anopheles farauti TaxID=69004 RepID=A0A182Q299_9DIPT
MRWGKDTLNNLQDVTGHSVFWLNHSVRCSVWPPCRHVWHQLNHFENGFDCHPICPWMAWLCEMAPIVVPMCSRHSAHRGSGLRQCGQEDSLCMLVALFRIRASSCSAIDTFLPQKLHSRKTDRELRGGDRMLPSVMSSCERCSHKPHTSSMSRLMPSFVAPVSNRPFRSPVSMQFATIPFVYSANRTSDRKLHANAIRSLSEICVSFVTVSKPSFSYARKENMQRRYGSSIWVRAAPHCLRHSSDRSAEKPDSAMAATRSSELGSDA